VHTVNGSPDGLPERRVGIGNAGGGDLNARAATSASPAIAGGTVYIGSQDSKLYALSAAS
jgi:outer membrane protein assembly factor BamB